MLSLIKFVSQRSLCATHSYAIIYLLLMTTARNYNANRKGISVMGKKELKFSAAAQVQMDEIHAANVMAMKEGKALHLNYIDAELIKVITNTHNEWLAVYKDAQGEYLFQLTKRNNKYFIISDGMEFGGYTELEGVIWNYESQLAQVIDTALIIQQNLQKPSQKSRRQKRAKKRKAAKSANKSTKPKLKTKDADEAMFSKIKDALDKHCEIFTDSNVHYVEVDIDNQKLLVPLCFTKVDALAFGEGNKNGNTNIIHEMLITIDLDNGRKTEAIKAYAIIGCRCVANKAA